MKKTAGIQIKFLLIAAVMIIIGASGSAFGQTRIVYSDAGIDSGSDVYTWWGGSSGSVNEITSAGLPEGTKCMSSTANNTFVGWGIFYVDPSVHVVDLSEYLNGYLKFWVKTPVNLKVEIQRNSGSGTKYSKQISAYGWNGTNTWQEIIIPVKDFTANTAILQTIHSPFMITAPATTGTFTGTFLVDYVRWSHSATAEPVSIKVYPKTASLAIGDTKELIALGFDFEGNPVPITPSWSVVSGAGVGTIISTSGNRAIFRGDSEGGATVKAAIGSLSASTDITVAPADQISTIIYNIYSDAGLPSGVSEIPLMPEGPPAGPTCTEVTTGGPEGDNFYNTSIGTANWGGWWIQLPGSENLNLYESGLLKFYVRSSVDLVVRLKGGDKESFPKAISSYGWVSSPNWQAITIPLVDFAVDQVDFTSMQNVFLVGTQGEPGQGTEFAIDHVRYEASYAVPARFNIVISGRQLTIRGEPFTVKGVCYSPTPVGEGYRNFDISQHPELYERDFRLMKAMGANTIRIYKPPTNIAFLDAALNNGIYVIMDYSIPHDSALTDPAVRQVLKNGFLSMVNNWKNHPAVLMWNFGNEINIHLNGLSPAGWYGFVNEVAAAAHAAEGDEYRPVIAASAEPNRTNGITAEIGDFDHLVPSLDAWAVQPYRGSTFGNLFSEAAAKTSKPIILTEFGCDAYDAKNGREEQGMQADYLQSQLSQIEANLSETDPSNVCIGGTVFMWSDDWSKAQWGWPDSVHDTAGQFPNPAYYDYVPGQNNINEEWWGICAKNPDDPNDRILRNAYFTIRQIWKGAGSFMTASIEPAVSALTWSGVIAGENGWKVADQKIRIDADTISSPVWGIQIYTDNTNPSADPRYTGDLNRSFNLVAKNNTTQGVALCWKISDTDADPGTPVWVSDRGDAENTEGFTDYQWRWMKDAAQANNPFVINEEYVRVWDQNGIYWADHVGPDVDPTKPGMQPCPAPAASPNYVHIGLWMKDTLMQEYGTNRLIVEFIFP